MPIDGDMPSPISASEDVAERLQVLKYQEVTAYRVSRTQSNDETTPNSSDEVVTDEMFNGTWRSQIAQWCYEVIDHYDYDREIVAVALNYLDRYLAKTATAMTTRKFQLLGMTALYLATKLYNPFGRHIKISALVALGRGFFDEDHVVKMEASILTCLSWHVHPPTPLTFVNHFVELLGFAGCSSSSSASQEISDVAKYLTELAAIDATFVPLKSSVVGTAAILTSIENSNNSEVSDAIKNSFHMHLQDVAQVNLNDPHFLACKSRLRDAFIQNQDLEVSEDEEIVAFADQNVMEQASTMRRGSPTSVSTKVFVSNDSTPAAKRRRSNDSKKCM